MEVNSSPGLKGIEAASNKDIAELIIQFIEKRFESLGTNSDKKAATAWLQATTALSPEAKARLLPK